MLSQIGPEPLSNSFNEAYFVSTLRLKKTNIKSALLDQRVVAGLGNIYVCEALFRAGISPKRQALRISHKKLGSLVPIIKEILLEAISSGGSSLRDFRNASGDLGYFQHSFDVYGREDQDCYNTECDSKIKRITQAGRSSFYCSNCQR
jgi:formamidopyrimidine-DNA glycosylase